MGDREIPFDDDEVCDRCGAVGAYDLMGDCYCPQCMEEIIPDEEEE